MNSSKGAAVGAFLVILALAGCEQVVQPVEASEEAKGFNVETATEVEKASYLLGFNQGQGLQAQTLDTVDMDAVLAGLTDFVAGNASKVDMEQAQALITNLQTLVQAKQQQAQQSINAEATAYRDEYASKEGVTKTESGLMYEVLKAGDGPKPGPNDTVVTHYHGTLISGEVFDSSVDRGQPATFPVGGVIRGWTEALQLMNVGSKWKLVIPPELAYGERGAGQMIGPNATLVFEVELLEIKQDS